MCWKAKYGDHLYHVLSGQNHSPFTSAYIIQGKSYEQKAKSLETLLYYLPNCLKQPIQSTTSSWGGLIYTDIYSERCVNEYNVWT